MENSDAKPLSRSEEFARLCLLVQQMLQQLEKDVEALQPLSGAAAERKSALAERQGTLTSIAKLVQLFGELLELHQQMQKLSGGEEEIIAVTEADLEAIERYFGKCREMGLPLLGVAEEA